MSTNEWKKENTVNLQLRVNKASDILHGLQAMSSKTGTPVTLLMKQIILDRLQADGYISKENK